MSMGMMNTATTTGMSIATTKHTHTVETAVTAQKSITTAKTAPAGHAGTGTAITTPNTIITATRGITTRTRCSQAGEWNRKFAEAEVAFCLTALDSGDYGAVLRAKGIVPAADGTWLHFDYVPGEQDIRTGAADYTGRLCVIGAQLNEAALKTLFGGEA